MAGTLEIPVTSPLHHARDSRPPPQPDDGQLQQFEITTGRVTGHIDSQEREKVSCFENVCLGSSGFLAARFMAAPRDISSTALRNAAVIITDFSTYDSWSH